MLFSCKISDSFLKYLDHRGEDLQLLEDGADLPPFELLRDPSYWLEAPKMESLLRLLLTKYEANEPGLISKVGHGSRDLRAWGTLDSVLRMVQNPKDLYAQPARLLSYFISPAPPIGTIVRESESVSFEIPVASSEYPLVAEYLRSAFESLPTYTGKTLAQVAWSETRIKIEWSEQQESFLEEGAATNATLNPEVVQAVLADLERSQKQLEETNRLLHQKEKELEALRKQLNGASTPEKLLVAQTRPQSEMSFVAAPTSDLVGAAVVPAPQLSGAINEIMQQVYRLGDYFGRSQQLVTLLVGQDRLSPQVQEAMRRVDWPRIQGESRHVVTEAALQLKKLQNRMEEYSCQKSSPSTPAKF